MRIAFFGGSFDPPHLGHLAVAQAAAQHLALDQVLLAPTGRQPFKRAGAEAPFTDRLAMVSLLCELDERLVPSTLDAPNGDGTPNYTVDALTRLAQEHPNATLFAIVGADSLTDLPGWRESARLFELASWISVSRPQHPFPQPLPPMLQTEQERGHLHLIPNIDVPTSSTSLRDRLRQGSEDMSDEIPENILRYIRSHELYSSGHSRSGPSAK